MRAVTYVSKVAALLFTHVAHTQGAILSCKMKGEGIMFLFKFGKVCVMFIGATTIGMLVVAFMLIAMLWFGGVS